MFENLNSWLTNNVVSIEQLGPGEQDVTVSKMTFVLHLGFSQFFWPKILACLIVLSRRLNKSLAHNFVMP